MNGCLVRLGWVVWVSLVSSSRSFGNIKNHRAGSVLQATSLCWHNNTHTVILLYQHWYDSHWIHIPILAAILHNYFFPVWWGWLFREEGLTIHIDEIWYLHHVCLSRHCIVLHIHLQPKVYTKYSIWKCSQLQYHCSFTCHTTTGNYGEYEWSYSDGGHYGDAVLRPTGRG